MDQDSQIVQFTKFLQDRLRTVRADAVRKLARSGNSPVGTRNEDNFTYWFLRPQIENYFYDEIYSTLSLTDEEIRHGLLIEGYKHCPKFSNSPSLNQEHVFRKEDVKSNTAPDKWKSKDKLSQYRPSPDFGIKKPLPFCAVGEVEFFNKGNEVRARNEFYNACREAVFYLGAFRDVYDAAIVVVADATPTHAFTQAYNKLNPDLLRRFGKTTGIYPVIAELVK